MGRLATLNLDAEDLGPREGRRRARDSRRESGGKRRCGERANERRGGSGEGLRGPALPGPRSTGETGAEESLGPGPPAALSG